MKIMVGCIPVNITIFIGRESNNYQLVELCELIDLNRDKAVLSNNKFHVLVARKEADSVVLPPVQLIVLGTFILES